MTNDPAFASGDAAWPPRLHNIAETGAATSVAAEPLQTPDQLLQIGVLIVCYQGRLHLPALLQSLNASIDAGITAHIVVVDNASTDGSLDWLAANYPSHQNPNLHIISSETNLGFAGGNNLALEHLRRIAPDARYAALLNQDTRVGPGWLAALASYLEANSDVAAAQAKIMLDPETQRFNTAGNQSHILGFGFTTAYREEDDAQYDTAREIDFPSGAAAMVRLSALPDGKLFDDEMFCYLEDADLGWKLRQTGHRIAYVPSAVVYHKYKFQNGYHYYYYLERNRLLLLFTYYKLPTLLLLSPIALAMELGQLYFAVRQGVLSQRWAAWGYFLSPKNLRHLGMRRTDAGRRRRISDRDFLKPYVAGIDFPELKSRLLKRVANPMFIGYWRMTKQLIFW